MTDSPSSRPAGGVEDRELVERVAQAISAVDGIDWDRTSGAVRNIERERAEAAVREVGSAGNRELVEHDHWCMIWTEKGDEFVVVCNADICEEPGCGA